LRWNPLAFETTSRATPQGVMPDPPEKQEEKPGSDFRKAYFGA
jgi:hypothetical protein